MKVKEKRKCDRCGELFTPRSSRQHYCRKEITKTCPVCGDTFVTNCSDDERLCCTKKECKNKAASMVSGVLHKICKRCGDAFDTQMPAQLYCGQIKKKTCPICGSEFEYVCGPDVNATCGNVECQTALIMENRTNSALELTRVCKWCGKEFHPKDWRDVYCYDTHYKNCAICGKQFVFDPRKSNLNESNTCSKECMGKLMSQNHDYVKGVETYKKNMLEKYGVDNPLKLPEVREKGKKTCLKKYGAEWYTQTAEYKERAKKTNLEKYGSEWYTGSAESMERRTSTNLEKYGVKNVFQSEDIKEKLRQTNIQKYGVIHPAQNEDIKEAVKQKHMEKYGVAHPMMLPKYKQKAYTQQHIQNIERWYEFIDNPRAYVQKYYERIPRTKEIAADLGVGPYTIDTYLGRYDAFDCVRRARSLMEEEMVAFLKSIDESIEVVCGSKSIIRPYEIDIFLPKYNFGIECDPTCSHNSSVPFRNYEGNITPPSYHKMKTDLCEERGINLLHIFGYDWSHKKDIILSMIKNRIGKSDNVIYARKCKVVEVSGTEAIKFLNENHRQGAANSPIRLGLEHEGKLVSLMTFGKMRGTIGTGKEDLSDCCELVRFCSLLNTSVVGGASKLMKQFIKDNNPNRIRSFSDRAHTTGKLYSTLGFKEIRRSEPGYVWVNVVDDVAYHRTNAQKKNIKKFLKDDSIDLSKTEREIMIDHGFVQVYDSGTITWEWIEN